MKTINYKKLIEQIKDFAKKKPVHFAGAILAAIILFFWILSSLELLPEVNQLPRFRTNKSVAIEQGDSLVWLGMQVVPVSRTIRQEFKIPRKIKGMFVLDEGKLLAKQYGIKTADVIVSVSRKPVTNARAFVNAANSAQYYDGILLDIYRDGKSQYITIPFAYKYGPLVGPYKGSWQLGSPLLGNGLGYGPVMDNNLNNQNR